MGLVAVFQPARLNEGSSDAYGFGWMLGSDPVLGRKVYHNGRNPGYATMIVRYLDTDKTILLLCNNGDPRFKEIVKSMEALLAESVHP